MKFKIAIFGIITLLASCQKTEQQSTFSEHLRNSPSIQGNSDYIDSPYVTAGDRVYMVGHQNGSFPEIGWHVKGEMGGIWMHPIKLMDGFDAEIQTDDGVWSLDKAGEFVNYPTANVHRYNSDDRNLLVERWQFVPDGREGLAVQYLIRNKGDEEKKIQFHLTGHSDLMPVWLGERTNMTDGADVASYNEEASVWSVKDSASSWYLTYGLNTPVSNFSEEENEFLGKGVSNSLTTSVVLGPGADSTITLVISGSMDSEKAALETYRNIMENYSSDLEQKIVRMGQLAERSKLTIPDKDLEECFEWLKYNCDWLVRTVPGIGTGISAGIPDYPWWFGVDSEYSLQGYMAIGQTETVYQTIKLLDSVSRAVNGNGRIIHEMSTNGAVFNEGNINETPQFASLIWEIYRWNGDKDFLRAYFPTIKDGLHWLMSENDANGNLFPDGFGMMEIHGLDSEMIDVAAYTQRAFEDASKIAGELGENDIASEYQKTATELRQRINSEFWSSEFSSYADFIGTDEQTLHLIEDAIVRADTLKKPWAIDELKQTRQAVLNNPSAEPRPFVLHHNWVVNTPMEMNIADEEKAIKALNTAQRFVNPFGVFVTGIDRDETAGSDDGSFEGSKVFSYTGAVMTLPTGVQAIAENNYGRPDKALDYIKRMTRTFSYALPGSMYEVSPDYGMMTQAWNIYSYAVPIIRQFFGIQPMASEKVVQIRPLMPSEWNEASLENVEISDNKLSVYYSKSDVRTRIEVKQTNEEWTISLGMPKSEGVSVELVEGEAEMEEKDGYIQFVSKNSRMVIETVSDQ